jgi:hypothetical protein
MGAGFPQFGFIFASFNSNLSILRCSWGWGSLGVVMPRFSHRSGGKGKPGCQVLFFRARIEPLTPFPSALVTLVSRPEVAKYFAHSLAPRINRSGSWGKARV